MRSKLFFVLSFQFTQKRHVLYFIMTPIDNVRRGPNLVTET